MIGDRIKSIRIFKNLTQEELVNGICSIAYLSKIENGQTKPSIEFLSRLSKKLEINSDLLISPFNAENIDKDVSDIFNNCWKREKLNEIDIIKIQMYLTEMHNNTTLLMMYSILIRYYYISNRLSDAKDVLRLSDNILNLDDPINIESEKLYYYYLVCGALYYELYEFEKSEEYYKLAEIYIPNDNREKARFYYNLSIVYQLLREDKSLCLEYSERAYNYLKETGEASRIVNILLVRSTQYYLSNLPDKALECTIEAQNLLKIKGIEDIGLKSSVTYGFGRIFQLKGLYEEAISYYHDYIKLAEIVLPGRMIKGYKRLAEINITLREWDKAEYYVQLAKNVATIYKEVYFDKDIRLIEIFIYKTKQQNDKYEKEMQKLLEYCIEKKDRVTARYLAKELGIHFHKKKSYKKSSEYFYKANEIELENNTIREFDKFIFDY